MATVQSSDPIKVITVRGTAFAAAEPTGGSGTVETIAAIDDPALSDFLGEELTKSERPELTAARELSQVGAACNQAKISTLLKNLRTSWRRGSASRAAVDAGYKPNDYQVGQTGKVVAPELYVAVGFRRNTAPRRYERLQSYCRRQ